MTTTDQSVSQDAMIAFIAGVAQMSLRTPPGISAQAHQAQRLREIRNAARHVMNCQFDELAQAVSSLLSEGRVVYTGKEGFSAVAKAQT